MPLLTDLPPKADRRWPDSIFSFKNNLAGTGLFTDEALAALIDAQPRDKLDITTMRLNPPGGERWWAGEAKGMPGAQLLQAAKQGSIWINLRRVMADHPRYRALLDQGMAEFSRGTGARILSSSANLLISAANMGIFYHADIALNMLWHVRGTKTILVYPRHAPYLDERGMEAILLKENLSDAPYEEAFDTAALPVVLHPGDCVSWPQHAPHRVLNGDDLNVSVSCEYTTPETMLANGVLYVNGVVRRRFGSNPSVRSVPKAFSPAYWAVAKTLQRFAPPKANVEQAHPRDFDVDLAAPECVRWRPGRKPAWVLDRAA